MTILVDKLRASQQVSDNITDDGKPSLYQLAADRLEAQQAMIDRLMLEYCPEDMSEDQIEEWRSHQRVSYNQNLPLPYLNRLIDQM